jgi:hypothetical protein
MEELEEEVRVNQGQTASPEKPSWRANRIGLLY